MPPHFLLRLQLLVQLLLQLEPLPEQMHQKV
jgi:hypothetical protein